jgi:hypothetical protein
MSFIIKKFGEIDFVNKSWRNDPRIGYKSPSSLVELINIDVDLQKEIEEFEFVFLKK